MNEKIFIGTPCFEYKVNANYTKTLLEFSKLGINFEPFFIHDSLITRARNELITQFYEDSTFTHLFWLDSDVSIPGEGLLSLLSHKVNVVAAPVPIKNLNLKFHQSIRKVYEEVKPYLYKSEAAATGAFLMTKKSVDLLIENSKFYFINDTSDRKIYNVFEVCIRDGEYMSEDWDISYKLRDLGIDIYVDSSFPVIHSGTYEYMRGPGMNKEMSKKIFNYD